jgi:hypothetical protein
MRVLRFVLSCVAAVAVLLAGASIIHALTPETVSTGLLLAMPALLKRGGERFVDSFAFVSGQRQPMDIDLPNRYVKRVWLFLRGQLTISVVTVPGAVHPDGPVNLLDQLELRVDGRPLKFGSGASFFRLAQRYDQTEGVNGGLNAAGAGVYDFEAAVPILFESPQTVNPFDTLLDGRRYKKLELILTWGTTASLITGNTSTLALAGVTADVYLDDTEAFPTSNPFWQNRETETTFNGIVTSAQTRLAIPFTDGAVMRAILIRALDAGVVSDAIINQITLRLNGSEEIPLNQIEDDFFQALEQHRFAGSVQRDGWYHLELAENGRVLRTGLGANGRLNSVDLIVDTTVGVGATSIVAHTVEYVPPARTGEAVAG